MATSKLTRRQFLQLSGLGVGSLLLPSCLQQAKATLFTAANDTLNQHFLVGLADDLALVFKAPLPYRAHDIAYSASMDLLAIPARRPGTDLLICRASTGAVLSRIQSHPLANFVGHATFSPEGTQLFVPEYDYANKQGKICHYRLTGEGQCVLDKQFSSGGVGPHQLKMLGSKIIVVANGGIHTHPSSGSKKLNLDSMQSNLSFIDWQSGKILEQQDVEHPRLSIRHFDINQQGNVAFGCQFQRFDSDNGSLQPLVYETRHRQSPRPLAMDNSLLTRFNDYTGSLAFSADGKKIAVTSPRGNLLSCWQENSAVNTLALRDVCGVTKLANGFVTTTGEGRVYQLDQMLGILHTKPYLNERFDNHLTG